MLGSFHKRMEYSILKRLKVVQCGDSNNLDFIVFE